MENFISYNSRNCAVCFWILVIFQNNIESYMLKTYCITANVNIFSVHSTLNKVKKKQKLSFQEEILSFKTE